MEAGKMYDRLKKASFIVDRLQDYLEKGTAVITPEGKIVLRFGYGGSVGLSKWYWFRYASDSTRKCGLYLHVFFQKFGLLPYRCEKCWKVIVRPKMFKEMVEIGDWIEKETDWHGKYGYDGRDYTFGRWGLYVYCDSLKEAEQKLNKLRRVFDLPEHWIQHACTEMNNAFGDSSLWKLSDKEIESQKKLEERFVYEEADKRPVDLQVKALKEMMELAYADGDETVRDELSKRFPEIRKWCYGGKE
jgi:hypothetical protein